MIKLSTYARLLLEKMTVYDAERIFSNHGVPNARSLPKEELKKKWRELVKKHHTDISSSNPEIIKDINAAYDLLKTVGGSSTATSKMPPWETDERAFAINDNPPVGNIQYYKKKAWELSGKPEPIKNNKYTFRNWDGLYFRQSITVYTTNDPDIWFEISNLVIEWDRFYRSTAVFVSQEQSRDLYLINHKGKKIIPPIKYTHDSFNLNPDNDRQFTDMLRKTL